MEKQQRKYNYSNFEQTKIIEFCSNPNKKFENDDNTDSALSHKQTNKYYNIGGIQTMKKIQIYQFQINKLKALQYWRNQNITFATKKIQI